MAALNVLGVVAAAIAGLAAGFLIMVLLLEPSQPSDMTLIALCGAITVAVIAWGATGARRIPKWLALFLMFPAMFAGICAWGIASDRYPSFHAYFVGSVSIGLFVVAALAVSWRSINFVATTGADTVSDDRKADIFTALLIYIFSGFLFFQPLVLLLNGREEAHSRLVFPGSIARMYETEGKHSSDFIVFKGPAAAFQSTWSAGEFEVSPKTYRSMSVGDRRCLIIHDGLLRFRWWAIEECASSLT